MCNRRPTPRYSGTRVDVFQTEVCTLRNGEMHMKAESIYGMERATLASQFQASFSQVTS
jgi:hypothetical protein